MPVPLSRVSVLETETLEQYTISVGRIVDGVVDTQSHLAPGALFAGRYRIERPLGEGGMGSVYLAEDTMFEHERVALKILHSHLSKDTRHSKRFLREVQLTRKLSHPNVVRTYDVGTAGENLFFTMEYIEGQSLKDRLATGPLGPYEVPYILAEVAAGLQAVHDLGIVHRDLKPGNVILDSQGGVKITDFGVARNGVSDLTSTNEIVGSVTYVAPEVWLGKEATSTCDIYALGVMAYQMLTGILPFDGQNPAEVMCKHLELKPTPPHIVNEEIPGWLSELVMKLLEKEVQNRPQSATEVRSMVDAHRTGAGNASHLVHPTSKPLVEGDLVPETARAPDVLTTSEDFFRDTFDGPPPDLKPQDTYITPSAEFAQTISKVRAQRAKERQKSWALWQRLFVGLGLALLIALICLGVLEDGLQSAFASLQDQYIGVLAVIAYLQLANIALVICLPLLVGFVAWRGPKAGLGWWLLSSMAIASLLASFSLMRVESMVRIRSELKNAVIGGGGPGYTRPGTLWAPPSANSFRCRVLGICGKGAPRTFGPNSDGISREVDRSARERSEFNREVRGPAN